MITRVIILKINASLDDSLRNRIVMDIKILDQGRLLKEKKDMKIEHTQKVTMAGFQFYSF